MGVKKNVFKTNKKSVYEAVRVRALEMELSYEAYYNLKRSKYEIEFTDRIPKELRDFIHAVESV